MRNIQTSAINVSSPDVEKAIDAATQCLPHYRNRTLKEVKQPNGKTIAD